MRLISIYAVFFILTHTSHQTLFSLVLFFISLSQERVIENLREQKETEDRVRLDELEKMRKENQELKDRLSAVQPQKISQSQPLNSGSTQNQRPDGEVSKDTVMSYLKGDL